MHISLGNVNYSHSFYLDKQLKNCYPFSVLYVITEFLFYFHINMYVILKCANRILDLYSCSSLPTNIYAKGMWYCAGKCLVGRTWGLTWSQSTPSNAELRDLTLNRWIYKQKFQAVRPAWGDDGNSYHRLGESKWRNIVVIKMLSNIDSSLMLSFNRHPTSLHINPPSRFLSHYHISWQYTTTLSCNVICRIDHLVKQFCPDKHIISGSSRRNLLPYCQPGTFSLIICNYLCAIHKKWQCIIFKKLEHYGAPL